MTYIDYLNRFNRSFESNNLPANAQLLYYKLLDVFNSAGWPGNMRIDTVRLMMMSKSQKKAAYRARDALRDAGFITYKRGCKGKPTVYFLCHRDTENDTINGTVNGTINDTVNDTQEKRPKTEKHTPHTPQGAGDGFDAFWAAYPKKVGKGEARKAWGKARPGEALRGRILAAVEAQKQSAQWQREGGRYIPNPATWLNQQRWEDELEGAGPADTTPDGTGELLPDTQRVHLPEDATLEDILELIPSVTLDP